MNIVASLRIFSQFCVPQLVASCRSPVKYYLNHLVAGIVVGVGVGADAGIREDVVGVLVNIVEGNSRYSIDVVAGVVFGVVVDTEE